MTVDTQRIRELLATLDASPWNKREIVASVPALLAENDALRAELQARQWQPIETAPKDSTVWAYNGEQGRMRWIEGEGYALWAWEDELLSDVDPMPIQPTSWMPLPPAPPQGETA
ncbi:hypothetical protein [Bordetella petrii]|uniref:hypothetical protein n=1 Tax=Bordetella petrii TaxID=94624 RepID=UPI0004911B8C|nr:hypothetical protein [Bordetella petrii]